MVNLRTLPLNEHFMVFLCGSRLQLFWPWSPQNLLRVTWRMPHCLRAHLLCRLCSGMRGWFPATLSWRLSADLRFLRVPESEEEALGKRQNVSALEETQTFRTSVPWSNNLISGAPVTCERWSFSKAAVIFSLLQSINIQ